MQRPTRRYRDCDSLFLAAAYLWVVGVVMLVLPGAASMTLGAPLLHGLELAGPFMFLLAGAVGALIGWGLFGLTIGLDAWPRLQPWLG